jgi:hypothetical protein
VAIRILIVRISVNPKIASGHCNRRRGLPSQGHVIAIGAFYLTHVTWI